MTETPQPAPAPAAKPNPVRELTLHFLAAYQLVHSDGHAYAIPRPGGHLEHGVPGVAQPFGAELRRKIVRLGPLAKLMVSRATADTVMLHLEAKAFEGPEALIDLRFHHDPDVPRLCIDLGRGDGKVIVVRPYDRLANPYGWTVEPPPAGVTFRRSHATKPLPEPIREVGRLDMLCHLWALAPAGEEFRALLGWLLGLPWCASVRPGALLVGPYGSGKSTRLRLAASLLEPSSATALGSAFGRNFGDDLVRAVHRPVPLWDNLTAVSGATSDALCCLVTGTARETRALYSDNDLNVVPVARPVGLTAVGVPAGLRPDALDRLVTIDVPPLVARLDDAELQRRFELAHPALLGAVCTALSVALRYLDRVPALNEFRMAGHARMLAAVDAATAAGELPGCPGGLLEAYAGTVRRAKQRTATDDVFGGALLSLLDATAGGQWQGKASELVAAAGLYAVHNDRLGPGWPSSPRRVPEVLNQLRDGLEAVGVTWSTTTVRGSTRYAFALAEGVGFSVTKAPPPPPPPPTPPPPTPPTPPPQTHPKAHPECSAVTCGNVKRGGRGGRGGLLAATFLFDSKKRGRDMGRYPEQAHHAHHAHPDPGGGSWADLVEILGFLLIVTGWGALTAAAGMVATGLGVLVAGVGLAVAGGIACWAAVQLHRPPSPAPAEAEPPVIGGPA